jgi:hypothetical protein
MIIFGNSFLFQNENVCGSHNSMFYPVIQPLITGLTGTSQTLSCQHIIQYIHPTHHIISTQLTSELFTTLKVQEPERE